jgi:MinD-like ATPase involved in chromosome partitioning or flagellar assembly
VSDQDWQSALRRSLDPAPTPTDWADESTVALPQLTGFGADRAPDGMPASAPPAPAGDAARAPEPVLRGGTATDSPGGGAVDVSDIARRADVHGDPPVRRAGRALRAAAGSRASRDVEEIATLAEHANRAITTGRRITVAGVRGGAGKTTVSALLTTTLSGLRRDPVLAVDADADAGSLPLRLGPLGVGVRTAADGGISAVSAFDQVARYLDRTATGVWLWRRALSTSLARQDEAHAALLLRDRIRFLNRYFAVVVADLGAGMHGAVNWTMVADSHAVVLTGTATVDGVLGAEAALQRLADDHGAELLGRSLLVLSVPVAGPLGVDLDSSVARLGRFGAPVLPLPYDRHLALGGAIDLRRIGAGARTAGLRIAAAVMDRAVLA